MKNQKMTVALTPSQFDLIAHLMKSSLQNDGVRGAEAMSIPAALTAWEKQRPSYVSEWSKPGMLRALTQKERRADAVEVRGHLDASASVLKALAAAVPAPLNEGTALTEREKQIVAIALPFITRSFHLYFHRQIGRWQKNRKDRRLPLTLAA